MRRVAKSIANLVGHTPLLEIVRYNTIHRTQAKIIVKLESFNPLSSVKDRVALALIEDGEEKGLLKPDTTIVEATTGNMGIGLAAIAATRGYRIILTIPNSCCEESKSLLKALGAEIVLTDGNLGIQGAIDKSVEIAKNMENVYMPQQFGNPANFEIHQKTTALEIIGDTEGKIDVFVSGIGSGGTITGVGRALKSILKNIEVVGVEPKESPLLTKGKTGVHRIHGLGAGFLPDVLDKSIVDKIYHIDYEHSVMTVQQLAKYEGILVGISSGASLAVATQLAKKKEYKDKVILVILPDTGERYLSTSLFETDP
ncbi:cysteine synthase A [Candidatus Epulonipiscium fishelsonii]|nr:cysteine synthase A [Epulopiscium sp. SCG-C06WGA-EpuloA1]